MNDRQSVNMLLGERRRIYVDISSSEEEFVIRNPKFKLYEQDSKRLEDEGDCRLEIHTISVAIQPTVKDTYVLEFSMEIAEEIIIKKVLVNVL